MILALVLSPIFPMNVVLTPAAMIALPLVALVVGLIASALGMRRVTAVDPATAFAAS